LSLEEYKAMEARLYGELLRACRRYEDELSIISVLGILDLVKGELRELDKANRDIMKGEIPSPEEEAVGETGDLETIL